MPELQSNRNFLTQFCHTHEMILANTHFAHCPEKLVTYYELWAKPMDDIQDNKFAQLDYIMCGVGCMNSIKNIESLRQLALGSHHFLLLCEMENGFQFPKDCKRKQLMKMLLDYSVLQNDDVQHNFLESFKRHGARL